MRYPPARHSYIRATNLAERRIQEERRPTKTIPHFFDERSGLKLGYAALLRASTGNGVTISNFDRLRPANLLESPMG